MKWSPDIVSRSAKWCETEVQDGAIRQRVLEVRDRAKVRKCKGAKAEWSETMRQSKLKSEFWGKTSLFFGVDTKVLNTNMSTRFMCGKTYGKVSIARCDNLRLVGP